MEPQEAAALYTDGYEQLAARVTLEQIGYLNEALAEVEKACWKAASKMKGYQSLRSLPGIGPVLAGVIRLETGPVERFDRPEYFASYCRTVAARRESNGKKKGENNRKCGNRYLAWAFIEAANLARRYDEDARRWFDRKASKTSKVIATKALACKLSKAAWHLMRQGVTYEPARLFGTPA
jgi:transposase